MHMWGRYFVCLAASVAIASVLHCTSCSENSKDNFSIGLENTTITVPIQMIEGEPAVWHATWTGANGPFTVVWNFGNGAEPNTVTSNETGNTATATVTMLNLSTAGDANYTVTVSVTDANGRILDSTASYSVAPTFAMPTIASTDFDAATRTLTATATADQRALPVTFTVAASGGISTIGASSVTVALEPLTADFAIGAEDIFAGGSGTATMTVTDAFGHSTQTSLAITIPALGPITGDTILAVPIINTATVTDTVTVAVITTVPASPFQRMNCVCVTFPDWVHYVPLSFNPGGIGGSDTEPDGIWGPGGMDADFIAQLATPDVIHAELPGYPGRDYLECRVLPVGGQDLTTASGMLCNFQVSFDHAGTASLGLLDDATSTRRTYYSDGAGNEYFWGELMAGPNGALTIEWVDNTIVVAE